MSCPQYKRLGAPAILTLLTLLVAVPCIAATDYTCALASQLTTTSGSFGVKSGVTTAPLYSCQWVIVPVGMVSVTVSFSQFALTGSDYLAVYYYYCSTTPTFSIYTAGNIPGTITTSAEYLLIYFYTTDIYPSSNFVVDYTAVTSTTSPCSITTPTPSRTPTRTPSRTPTRTPSPSRTPTWSPSRTPTRTPTYTPSRTPTRTPSRTPTRTPTYTPSRTPTYTPSHTPTRTPSYTPSRTPTLSPTSTPTVSAIATLTPTPTPAGQCPFAVTLTFFTATLRSQSTSTYINSQICQWFLRPPGMTSITIQFSAFNLQSFKDWLYISFWNETTGTLTTRSYTGAALPANVSFPATFVTIQFFTDASIVSTGFVLTYNAT